MFKAVITVTFKKSILDPQGAAVFQALKSLGYQNVEDVRVGKHIEMKLKGTNKNEAQRELTEMCTRLLANPVIEDFKVELSEVSQ